MSVIKAIFPKIGDYIRFEREDGLTSLALVKDSYRNEYGRRLFIMDNGSIVTASQVIEILNRGLSEQLEGYEKLIDHCHKNRMIAEAYVHELMLDIREGEEQ